MTRRGATVRARAMSKAAAYVAIGRRTGVPASYSRSVACPSRCGSTSVRLSTAAHAAALRRATSWFEWPN